MRHPQDLRSASLLAYLRIRFVTHGLASSCSCAENPMIRLVPVAQRLTHLHRSGVPRARTPYPWIYNGTLGGLQHRLFVRLCRTLGAAGRLQ